MSVPAERMTQEILGAWDEIEPEASSAEDEPDNTAEAEEAEDQPSADEETEEVGDEEEVPDEGEEEEVEDEEEPSEEEQADEDLGGETVEAVASFSDDPDIQDFLTRHGGSPEAALKEAVRIERAMGRQGRDLGIFRDRVAELETELERANLFAGTNDFINDEQREWVEAAALSENPVEYIQGAVNAGEFVLARAVLEESQMSAGSALRVSQAIDRAEALTMQQAAPEEPLDMPRLLDVLGEYYPDMPRFEGEMVSTLRTLGEGHPLAAMARSNDPEQAAQGIIGLYEIARAKTATVSSTREQATKKRREAADAARENAVVSSGSASPPQAQQRRRTQIMPGLTLEALEAEFDQT